ncbi:MAG: isochorismate synthase [Gemmatimonadales bacterium]|nr:MAG: isochorismate synthase [Gemmatimonadales bacterium]
MSPTIPGILNRSKMTGATRKIPMASAKIRTGSLIGREVGIRSRNSGSSEAVPGPYRPECTGTVELQLGSGDVGRALRIRIFRADRSQPVPAPAPFLSHRSFMPSTSQSTPGRLLRRRQASIGRTDPGVFLDRFEGESRGFWGRGNRWVAWAGTLHEFTIPDSAPEDRIEGRATPELPRDRRFVELRRQLRALLGEWAGTADGHGSPRVFGGFSFLAAPQSASSWEGFPAARFVLPRVLLRGGPDGCELWVQRLVAADEVDDEGVEGELDRLVRELDGIPVPPRVLVPRASEVLTERNGEEREAWAAAVSAVLEAVRVGELEKAVLARIQDLELDRAPAVGDLIRFLRHENPRAHVFLFDFAPGGTLFGAAPEVLAELRGGRLHATAVAGSAARGDDDESDRRQADSLLASKKDRAEHRMTVDEMRDVLTDRVTGLQVADDPRILPLARIQHLESPIEGAVREGEDVLTLVAALHPTPAVCGRPREAALRLIRAREPFARGWYAGPVGWFDLRGEGDFVPALRVGVGYGRRWRLFAGAGIVEGSDPELEWEETALKFEPALRALRAGAAAP